MIKEIVAIDPGTTHSAWLIYRPEQHNIGTAEIIANEVLLRQLYNIDPADRVFLIEMVACYGMAVGKTVFETVFWIGRFWESLGDVKKELVYRSDVKMALCNSMRAKDSNIRQALLDKFPSTGGGKTPQIGTKKQPGPLYGISKDLWAALAIAVTYKEKA